MRIRFLRRNERNMNGILTSRESRTIYIARCLAILSVIAAHVEGQMSRGSLPEQLNAFAWQQYGLWV